MAISPFRKSIFIHARRVNDLPVVLFAVENKLQALINGNPALIQGLPAHIDRRDISRAKTLLNDECTLRIYGFTLLVGFKLRGGVPPWNGPDIAGKLPSTEDVMKDLDLGLDMTILGLNLTPALVILFDINPAVGVGAVVLAVTLTFLKSQFDSATFNRYKTEVDRLDAQSLDDRRKLAAMDVFLQANLPADLQKVGGLENYIALEIERLSQAKDVSALKEFIEIAACIYRYRDVKQASLLRTYGLALCQGLLAIGELVGFPNAPKWLGQALSAIRATLGVIQFSPTQPSTPNTMGIERAILLLHKAFKSQSDEVKERLTEIEGLIGQAWVGLTNGIEAVSDDIQALRIVSNTHFTKVTKSLNNLSSKIDSKANQSAQMQLTLIRGRIKNAVSPMNSGSYKDLVADIWTWAIQLSGLPGLIDSAFNSTDELGFFIGRLASLCGYQTAVHNPYVWALCCDAYIDLRTDITPDQPIPQLASQTTQFQSMIDAGENTLQFVEKVQKDKAFFQGLISSYKQLLIQVKGGGFTPQLITQFDGSCLQLRCFLRLCFSRSVTQDLFFTSLFKPHQMFAHSLMDANELQQHLQAVTSPEELWENLLESVDLLEKVVVAKMVSHGTGATDDQYILLTFTLYKLYKFAQKEFKRTLPRQSRRVFNTLPCHSTDLQALCTNNLLLAAKLGVIDEVIDLIDNGNQSPDARSPNTGRTPLHEAVKYNHENVVRALLGRGARVDIADFKGRLPIEDAKANSPIEKMLEAKGPLSRLGKGKLFKNVSVPADRYSNGGVRIVGKWGVRQIVELEKKRFPPPANPVWILVNEPGNLAIVDPATGKPGQTFQYDNKALVIEAIPQSGCTIQTPDFLIVTLRLDHPRCKTAADFVELCRADKHRTSEELFRLPQFAPFNGITAGTLEVWKWQGGVQSRLRSFSIGSELYMYQVVDNKVLISYRKSLEIYDLSSFAKTQLPAYRYCSSNGHQYFYYPLLVEDRVIAPCHFYPRSSFIDMGVWDLQGNRIWSVKKARFHFRDAADPLLKRGMVGCIEDIDRSSIKIYDLETGRLISKITHGLEKMHHTFSFQDNIAIIQWHEGMGFYDLYTGKLLQTIIGRRKDFRIEGDTLFITPKEANEPEEIWKLS